MRRALCVHLAAFPSAGEMKMQDEKAMVPVGANGASIYAVQ